MRLILAIATAANLTFPLAAWGATPPFYGLLERADHTYLQRDYSPDGIKRVQYAIGDYRYVAGRLTTSLDGVYARIRAAEALYFLASAGKPEDRKQQFAKSVAEINKAKTWFESKYGRSPELSPKMNAQAKKLFAQVLYHHALGLQAWIDEAPGENPTEQRKVERDLSLVMAMGLGSIEDYGPTRLMGIVKKDTSLLKTAFDNTRVGPQGPCRNGWNALSYAEALAREGKQDEAKKIMAEFAAAPAESLSVTLLPENRMLQKRTNPNAGSAVKIKIPSFGDSSIEAKEVSSESVPGEYVVKFARPVVPGARLNFEKQIATFASDTEVLDWNDGKVILVKSTVTPSLTSKQKFFSSNLVEIVEPNYIFHTSSLPNDPRFNESWSLANTSQSDAGQTRGLENVDVGTPRAWEVSRGSKDVIVAVIDTGVDLAHPDLIENLWTNEAEANGLPGIDDDANGYVDDIHGYDFAYNRSEPTDEMGHGTHTAGIVAARGNNGVGTAGVCWNCRIMPLKFIGRRGGTLFNAVRAIQYATKMGARISNNSWGSYDNSKILAAAIAEAGNAGHLFVTAAGNSNDDSDIRSQYPAGFDASNIVSVAAVDNRGRLGAFSNFGKRKVHIGAPGVNILSTVIGGYGVKSGTSMASPHVAGVAALVLSQEPNLSVAELKDRLMKTASPLASLREQTIAAGIVNAWGALRNQAAASDPHDPLNWPSQPARVASDHLYQSSFDQTWTVKVPNARHLAVRFKKFQTEKNFDRLYFFDGEGRLSAFWSGTHDGEYSPVIDGDTIHLRLVSDQSVNDFGFEIDMIAVEN